MVYNATAERLLQEPALEAPPGVERHMGARSPAAYYVCAVFCAVVPGTLLCLRLYTKTTFSNGRIEQTVRNHLPKPSHANVDTL